MIPADYLQVLCPSCKESMIAVIDNRLDCLGCSWWQEIDLRSEELEEELVDKEEEIHNLERQLEEIENAETTLRNDYDDLTLNLEELEEENIAMRGLIGRF